MSEPDSAHYQVQMQVADLSSLAPGTGAGGTTLVWQTQWHQPSSADTTNGGALWMVYAESVGGGAPTCWAGQSAAIATTGNAVLTYPGTTQLAGSACQFSTSPPWTITITVPTSLVTTSTPPDSNVLYSVTASSQTLTAANAEDPPPFAGIGGQLFNVIDAVPAFDFNPSVQTCQSGCVPESPVAPLLIASGGVGALLTLLARRRAHVQQR
jgi:hypothetical protein